MLVVEVQEKREKKLARFGKREKERKRRKKQEEGFGEEEKEEETDCWAISMCWAGSRSALHTKVEGNGWALLTQ